MILLACFILLVISIGNIIKDHADAKDWELDYDIAERRHQELLELEEKKIEAWQDLDRFDYKEYKPRRRRCTRTVATDNMGRTVAQEIIEEDIDEEEE